ncbi:MAG: hypothetical protein JWQ81_8571 [Amycolatopsis sp.]|uniref:hypothetical protein n=1 Tax=Amycolatopsis sp. TaxID=37632 RepID=UPI0026388393|nr:hypothetical protein [Amycolatopsis sp.]MCU1687832.1 hypothetical protein [Amycolatopsis sp.]
MTADPVPCLDCHRPLKDPASIARQRGRYCQEIFEGDTHISPKLRRPMRRKRLPEDRPFPDFPTERTPAVTDQTAAERIAEALEQYQTNFTRMLAPETSRTDRDASIQYCIYFFAYAALLARLREHDEFDADLFATWLEETAEDGGGCGELVHEWRQALAAGQPITFPNLDAS